MKPILLSRQQLQRRVDSKAWVMVLPGVFRILGVPEGWHQKLKALSLWAGADFALSHQTAAALHGFRRFKEGPLILSAPRHLSAPPPFDVRRARPFGPREVETVADFRVTGVTRTLIDLAAVISEKDLRATADEALQRKLTTVERLAKALVKVRRLSGLTFLRTLVREYEGGNGPCESEFESRIFEQLDATDLPRPVKQRVIMVAGRLRRIDYFFEDFGVVLEGDSYAYHSSPIAFEKDRERYNSLTARGFFVLQWTWKGLHDRPAELIAELKGVLASRVGWKARKTRTP